MFTKIDMWGAIFLMYYICNLITIGNTPCEGRILHLSLLILFYILLRCIPLASLSNQIWAYICVILGLSQAGVGLMQMIGIISSGHNLYSMTGTFSNPAPFGAYLSVMLSVIIATYKQENQKNLGLIAIILLIIILITWSRAALLASTLCIAILYRKFINKYWKTSTAVAIIFIIILYFLKQSSANSRLLMLKISMTAWSECIWFGSGVGGFLHTLGESQAKYFLMHPNSSFIPCVGVANFPFCEPMSLAVEGGFVGLALAAIIFILSAWKLWKIQHPLFYCLISLIIFSLFSYPFHILVFKVFLIIIIATSANIDEKKHISTSRACAIIGVVILGVTIYTLSLSREEAKKEYAQFSFSNEKVFIKEYYKLLPKLNDNPNFLFRFGTLLRNAHRYNDSNAMLSQGRMLSADPMFYILMGRNYEDMQEYTKAESQYLHAFNMVPNRIYPLYRQMKLYEKMGDSLRTQNIARKITNFKVKIESPVTRDIKKEAEQIITSITKDKE